MTTNQLRVVHVSSVHRWTDNRIHYRECVSLAEAGFSVTLIAVESEVQGTPTAVKVITLPRRSRLSRMVFSTASAISLALKTRASIVHLHDPELIPFIPLLRLAGRMVVYDAHEDLPAQVLDKPYLRPALVPVVAALARGLIAVSKLSNHVVCATETIAERYPSSKATVVHNYPPLRAEEEAVERRPVSDREPAAIYLGGISEVRGARVMVDAMAQPELPEGWQLVLAGSSSDSLLADLAGRPGWNRVNFRGQVPPDEARQLILQSRIGLVLFADTKAHRDALPTKMFEYFAAGTPVIASDFPLWRSIVEENQCGVMVNPDSSSQVASAIRRYAEDPVLLDKHARNARRLALEKFNWSQEGAALVSLYRTLARGVAA